ncbi:hypothetical protein DB30_04202 [Enhygromyxa salina]|uniref:Uncharacterized protein n=1 Tax=Enhygromyxa salina TaxID=215803 RepID=A0A0C1ZGJ7_9BACT|nr:hypothetical protein DB30_04202 [Enhygromyxa salina]
MGRRARGSRSCSILRSCHRRVEEPASSLADPSSLLAAHSRGRPARTARTASSGTLAEVARPYP